MSIMDYFISKSFKKKWNLNEKSITFTYTLPKNQKLKTDENNNIILYNQSEYHKHYLIEQFNIGIASYFGVFTLIQLYGTMKIFMKTRVKKVFLLALPLSITGIYETYYAYSHIKDPYKIILKDGKKLLIYSRQDEFPYEMDIAYMRVLHKPDQNSPSNIGYYSIIDAENTSCFRFFCFEIDFGSVFNKQVFDFVFEDKRYLDYRI